MTLRDSKSNFSAKGLLIHFPTAKKYMYMYMCIHVQWHCITLYKYVLHVHVPVYGERSYSSVYRFALWVKLCKWIDCIDVCKFVTHMYMYIHVVVVVHSQQYEACMCKCCPGYFTKDTYELYAVIQDWLLALYEHFIHVCCLHLLEVSKQQTCMKCSYCASNQFCITAYSSYTSWNFQQNSCSAQPGQHLHMQAAVLAVHCKYYTCMYMVPTDAYWYSIYM